MTLVVAGLVIASQAIAGDRAMDAYRRLAAIEAEIATVQQRLALTDDEARSALDTARDGVRRARQGHCRKLYRTSLSQARDALAVGRPREAAALLARARALPDCVDDQRDGIGAPLDESDAVARR